MINGVDIVSFCGYGGPEDTGMLGFKGGVLFRCLFIN